MENIGVGNVYSKFKYGDVSEVAAKQNDEELEFIDPDNDLFADRDEVLYHPYREYQGDLGLLPNSATEMFTVVLDDDEDDGTE